MAGSMPVTATALPLPAGASTETTLAAVLAKIIASPATETSLAAVLAKLNGTVAVSNATLPLPSGATTEVTLAKAVTGSTPTADAAGTTSLAISSGAGRLMGFSCRETAGATAVLRLRDGSGGTIVSTVSLAANESVRDWFGPNGITIGTSVYLERVSGTTEVSVFKS